MELSRVEIITSNSKIEALKNAMGKYGITGMTIFQVLGCGVQFGTQEYEVEPRKEPILLPKDLVMLVLPTKDVPAFLKFVQEELYTGHIGDGKIFVSTVTNAIRVRTGEDGLDALFQKEV